ncbi:MAG: BMP family ABC transporter substrate-binding protein, partial [Bacteroidetes bacterium]|nr:BMP family ABC transporter substrate-binding protein [Bacteroidota bacterium]
MDEVVGYTLMYSDVLTREHETSMMKASLQSLKPTDRPIGPMDREKWEGMQKLLLDNEFMDNAIDLDKAFTNEFLPTAQAAVVSTLERKAALVMDSSIDDIGWGTSHHQGLLILQDKMGYKIALSEKTPPAEWETAARDYAERGYRYVIMGGAQFTEVTAKIAPDYPKTTFIVVAAVPPFDKPFPSNMIGLDMINEQSGYLAGVLAGGMTKTNKVG